MTESQPIDHYENFPVASWLCPAHLRPPIIAIYHFARTADDIADEGDASADTRLGALQQYQGDLQWAYDSSDSRYSGAWPEVFIPLHKQVQAFEIPQHLLADLLAAFVQDVQATRDGKEYAEHAQVLDYCTRSANPVGRLLLHLYGVSGEAATQQSDAICTALQLINFWQDLSVDIPRGRYYISKDVREKFKVPRIDVQGQQDTFDMRELVEALTLQARHLMYKGGSLPKTVSASAGSKAGWELRFVVQGAMRLVDKIENMSYSTIQKRPKLHWWDMPVIAWRALMMRCSGQ